MKEEDTARLKSEIMDLHYRLSMESTTKEEIQEELVRVRGELEQLQTIYLNVVDYATTLENTLEEKIEKLTNEKLVHEVEEKDPVAELRHNLMQEVMKNEELHNMNNRLLEQLDQFRTLYVNTMAHSTVLENELDEKYREVSRLSITDSLTGAMNRAGFYKSFDIEITKVKRKNHALSLIMFDVDKFKTINDNYGHDVGDSVLMRLSEVVSGIIRKGDVFCRWGGDEFIIILPEMTLDNAKNLAERNQKAIQDTVFKHVGKVTCSFGVTEFAGDEDVGATLKRVDHALYDSKKKGRNIVSSR